MIYLKLPNLFAFNCFSYPAKNFGEHGAAENPKRRDLHVPVHGRVWFTVRLGKGHIIYSIKLYNIFHAVVIICDKIKIIRSHHFSINPHTCIM